MNQLVVENHLSWLHTLSFPIDGFRFPFAKWDYVAFLCEKFIFEKEFKLGANPNKSCDFNHMIGILVEY